VTHDVDPELLKTNFNVHDILKDNTVERNREINMSDRLPYAICLWNIEGNLNIGMSIRTACNLGAERVFVIGRKHYDKRSCVGTNHYLPIEVVKAYNFDKQEYDLNVFWLTMFHYGYRPVFIETGGVQSICSGFFDLHDYWSSETKPCLVFGSESEGIPRALLESENSKIYSIPQYGVIRSFNVSASVAIACWEFVDKGTRRK